MSGFWDDNPDVGTGGGGAYLSEDDKGVLVDGGVVFEITGVETQDNPFDDGERHVIKIETDAYADETEERLMAFSIGNVESRNRTLDRMEKYFETEDEPIPAKLVKVGRSYLVLPEGAEVKEKPAAKAKAKPAATAKPKSTAKRTTAKTATAKRAASPRRKSARGK